jgi:hypothetical protein
LQACQLLQISIWNLIAAGLRLLCFLNCSLSSIEVKIQSFEFQVPKFKVYSTICLKLKTLKLWNFWNLYFELVNSHFGTLKLEKIIKKQTLETLKLWIYQSRKVSNFVIFIHRSLIKFLLFAKTKYSQNCVRLKSLGNCGFLRQISGTFLRHSGTESWTKSSKCLLLFIWRSCASNLPWTIVRWNSTHRFQTQKKLQFGQKLKILNSSFQDRFKFEVKKVSKFCVSEFRSFIYSLLEFFLTKIAQFFFQFKTIRHGWLSFI